MFIALPEGFQISDVTPSDRLSYVEHLKERQIYDQTLAIPFPYTEADADWWIGKISKEAEQLGESFGSCFRFQFGICTSIRESGISMRRPIAQAL